ncbi:hypothetical protein Dsin_010865 [Dipteronia sinensis]|uniref:Uncharacterized protein n=1 Tax=Dipteronia sinensis TaxID=43782 RepID=A0AAE0EET8_9ROSI|nr:hypothetical protein Dsin_010865 [Dipteronia sinensis]
MAVLCVCLVGDQFLCSGSADKSIGIGRENVLVRFVKLEVISGHEGPVKCLQASSPNSVGGGFLLYSGGLDKTVRVGGCQKHSADDHKEDNDNDNKQSYKPDKSIMKT